MKKDDLGSSFFWYLINTKSLWKERATKGRPYRNGATNKKAEHGYVFCRGEQRSPVYRKIAHRSQDINSPHKNCT